MELNQLNSDCLRLIFSQLTINELVHLRLVCTRWKSISETVLHSHHSLKLFSNFKSVIQYVSQLIQYNVQHEWYYRIGSGRELMVGHDYDEDQPNMYQNQIDWTEPEKCDLLRLLFPTLTSLIVHLSYSKSFSSIERLLDQFPNLQDLSIFNIASGSTLMPMSGSNKLPHLRRLELFNFNLRDINIIHLGGILPQLEHFTLGYCYQSLSDTTDHITPMLLALERCQALTLNKVRISDQILRNFVQSKCDLVRKITHLTLNTGNAFRYGTSRDIIELVCERFCELIYFNMYPMHGISLDSLTTSLSNLPNLQSLHLFVDYSNLVALHQANPVNPRPLPGLRQLSMTVPFITNRTVIEQLFPQIFPNLTSLIIDHSSCLSPQLDLSRFEKLTSSVVCNRGNDQCYFEQSVKYSRKLKVHRERNQDYMQHRFGASRLSNAIRK